MTTSRVYHPWYDWECYRNGFYETKPPDGMTADEAKAMYPKFFSELGNFERAIPLVFQQWPKSCEHFLTNPNINRIAWLGQASICLAWKVPQHFKAGFLLLSDNQQAAANRLSKDSIEEWAYGRAVSGGKGQSIPGALAQRWLSGWDTGRVAVDSGTVAASAVLSSDCSGAAAQ